MDDTWVVAAEGSRARFFAFAGMQTPMREVEDLLNPEGRTHPRDLTSDRPGRTFDSVGGKRHAKEPATTPRQQRTRDFARLVSDRIERARTEGCFKSLILIAAPAFLGLLREQLSETTRQCIGREIRKDIVRQAEPEIRALLHLE